MSNKKENGYCTYDDLTFEDRVAQLQFENGWGVSVIDLENRPGCYEVAVLDSEGQLNYNTDITDDVIWVDDKDKLNETLQNIQNLDSNGRLPHNQNTERSQMRQVRCGLMRAESQNSLRAEVIASLRAEVLASFSTIAMSTPYPSVAIAAMMATERLVIRDNTDAPLVPPASRVYGNALMNPACNRDVVDVARDSTNNILNNAAERDLPNVQMSLQDTQNLLDQSELRFSNNRQIPDIEIPASSRNCMQTKYGAIDPMTEERTGHVLFQTPNGNHRVAPKKDIPDTYLDQNGNFTESSIKDNLTIKAKNNTQENNKDNKLTTAILNTLGNNECVK